MRFGRSSRSNKKSSTKGFDQEEKVGLQEQLASYYQRRQVLEEENAISAPPPSSVDEVFSWGPGELAWGRTAWSVIAKQIEVAKLQSSQAAHSRKENLSGWMLFLARLEDANKQPAQQTPAVSQQRLDREPASNKKSWKELANYEAKIRTSHWEHHASR